MKLLETYAKRISIAESVYSKEHDGEAMPRDKKIVVAACLNNANRYMNEAFENSVGTQRSDIGAYKKFIMNLTNIVMPNLIAFDLVMVKPMSARAGFVTFIEYVAGSNKGGVKQGDLFNNPFEIGEMTESRMNYTAAKVVEEAVDAGKTAWTPVDGKVEKYEEGEWKEIEVADIAKGDKIRYEYDNVLIPQNDLPILNARTSDIPLIAKPRRIAIYYSQMAAFEMKTEYGEDLGQNLSEQAVGELKYEIDTEIIDFLKNMAGEASITFSKTLPVGVSMAQHYESFKAVVNKARSAIYNRTRRFAPNYMVCAVDVLEVLAFCSGFKAASIKSVAGPYLAGTLDGLKVFVSPTLEAGEFYMGVNDGMTSAAVYAPYMPIIPTQLLGYADGAMSQGFSTMYALAKLNDKLVIAGKIVD